MSDVLRPNPADRASPFPLRPGPRVATALGIVAALMAILFLMGRAPVCPCGHVTLVQIGHMPEENSQQFADWYSLLHVAFGAGLFVFVRWSKPRWSFGAQLLAVLVGHSIWEIAENTPWIIGMFSGGPNAPFYGGDSLLNSFGDTVFAMLGAAAVPRLTLRTGLGILLAIETAVTWGVGDGFVVGTLRLIGVNV